MKKIFIKVFLLSTLSLVLTCICSCSKDEEKEVNDLIGKWSGNFNGEKSTFEIFSNGNLTWSYVDIDDGKTYTQTNNNYSVSGNNLRINFNVENGIVDDYTIGTYSIKGNTLTYTYTWHDGEGKWDHDEEITDTFTRI